MPNTHTLQVLLDQARRERDEALAALQTTEAQAEQAHTQAVQLQQYRSDYQSRWTQQFAGGIELMHSYRGFMQRLELAIGQQDHALAQARHRVQAARHLLIEREKRLAAVDKLIERRRHTHQAELQRREQRRADEAAQRWRGPAALRSGTPTTY